MFQRAIGIAVFLVFVSSPANTKEISKPPLSIKGMTAWGQRMYLDGVVDGFQIINAKLTRQEQEPLYCIPEKVVVYGRDLLEFASKDLKGPQDDMTIAVSGLFGLIEKYPCQAANSPEPDSPATPEAVLTPQETSE